MYRRQSVLLAILIILAISFECWGATYYVDATNGNDSNPGTSQATPWKTISKVNRSNFQPGDFIVFKRGEIWRETLIIPSSGLPHNHIVFSAYGSGDDPIISGSNVLTGWKQESENVYSNAGIITEPHVVIYNSNRLTDNEGRTTSVNTDEWDWNSNTLYINVGENPSGGTVEAGQRLNCIFVDDDSYITIENLEISGANAVGIMLDDGPSYITMQNNTIKNIGELGFKSGITIWGSSNCTANLNTISHAYNGINISGWNSKTSQSNTVSYNTVSYTDKIGIQILAPGAVNNIVEHNTVDNAMQAVDDAAGIYTYDAGAGNIIRYNLVYDCGTATNRCSGVMVDIASSATKVYYNILYGNTNGGVHVTTSGHEIYNNTMYQNNTRYVAIDGGEIGFFGSATNMVIKNNIMVASPGKLVIKVNSGSTIGHDIDNNLYYSSTGTLFHWDGKDYEFADWKTKSRQDDNSLNQAPPKFIDTDNNAFKLQNSSPAIDHGTDIKLTQDIFGTNVPQRNGVDIGAIEFSNISPPKYLRIYQQ